MKKNLFCLLAFCVLATAAMAKEKKDSATLAAERYEKFIDSVESAMKYETGQITLSGGTARLNVPEGFKFLNADQSNYIITTLWGNPAQQGVLGMLFPANGGPFNNDTYAFVITYDPMGYVKDEDADDMDYDQMMKDFQSEEIEGNKQRVAQGFEPIHMIGWATKPFYDKTNKVLHWAKNIKFGDSKENTLNYEVRILGRKGVLSMNAVASMSQLAMVKGDIDKVLKMPSFTEGNTYKDFDSKIDNVAAWTIGSLVAGKVLLKVGIWAMIGKFFIAGWKFIVIGLAAVGGAVKKFFGKKNEYKDDVA